MRISRAWLLIGLLAIGSPAKTFAAGAGPTPQATGSALRAQAGFQPDGTIAPRRTRLTWAPAGIYGLTATISSPGQTAAYAAPVPYATSSIRGIIVDVPGAGGNTIGPITYRPSTDWGGGTPDYVTPTDPGCVLGGSCFGYMTFNWAGNDSDIERDCCSPSTLVMPTLLAADPDTASTSTAHMVETDWAPFVYLPPTAGGNAPGVVMVRVTEPTGTLTRVGAYPGDTSESGSAYTGNAAINNGYDYSIKIASGVGFATSSTVTGASAGQGPLWGLQFDGGAPGIQLLCGPGDSWTEGNTTTAGMSSLCTRAAVMLSTPSLPVFVASCGWSGANSDTFVPPCIDAVALVRPSICVIQTFAAGDSITTFGTSRFLGRQFAFAKKCKERGAIVDYIAPFPRNTLSGASLTVWQNTVATVQSITDAATSVFPATQYLSTYSGGTPLGVYLSGLSTDGIHPIDLGVAAMQAKFNAMISTQMGKP